MRSNGAGGVRGYVHAALNVRSLTPNQAKEKFYVAAALVRHDRIKTAVPR